MPAAVYVLCFATSTACAWLLGRSFRRTGARLLLWSALCFVLLAAQNLLLVIDLLVLTASDFRSPRVLLALAAVGVLLFGCIWDLEEC
ncbi:hypothetical protein CKY28_05525 [Sphingomonas lenta]|uniref:Uncharacterized protein n=1 Tax=Sphingomonas lenta TaxID=1141887 RepID=A0A2A2SJF0_9SPHN|nr:hypothetical protein CKY28_05525 [Sphingomonas lenta]